MSYHVAGPYGSTSGTQQGPDGIGNTTPVTYINGYADDDYVYGVELKWDTSASRMYGVTNSLDPQPLDCDSDPVCQVKVFVDSTSGFLNGIKFKTVSGATLNIGYLDGDDKVTAFNNEDNVLTNMVTYRNTIIEGVKFRYTGPSFERRFSLPRELSFPALSVLAHTAVVVKSLMKVGKLRRELSIKAPSCDPPLTTSPANAQLWYRTFRAQENCKEMFLVYFPSILIASTLGYHAFGKWTPRTVGALTLASAFFRLQYLNAYIEDADKRGKPFYNADICMRPVFFIAIASSGYLLGKEVYYALKECKLLCKQEDDK